MALLKQFNPGWNHKGRLGWGKGIELDQQEYTAEKMGIIPSIQAVLGVSVGVNVK